METVYWAAERSLKEVLQTDPQGMHPPKPTLRPAIFLILTTSKEGAVKKLPNPESPEPAFAESGDSLIYYSIVRVSACILRFILKSAPCMDSRFEITS